MSNVSKGKSKSPPPSKIIERLNRIEAAISSQDTAGEKPLSFEEAADYLDLSKSWLYKLTARDAIPHYKPFGKKIYFLKTELDNFIRGAQEG